MMGNGNENAVLEWQWVGMVTGMIQWWWEGNENKKVIPAHLYQQQQQQQQHRWRRRRSSSLTVGLFQPVGVYLLHSNRPKWLFIWTSCSSPVKFTMLARYKNDRNKTPKRRPIIFLLQIGRYFNHKGSYHCADWERYLWSVVQSNCWRAAFHFCNHLLQQWFCWALSYTDTLHRVDRTPKATSTERDTYIHTMPCIFLTVTVT